MVNVVQKLAEYKTKRSNLKFLESIRKNICGGTQDILYDDLKNLYVFLNNNNANIGMDLAVRRDHPLYNLKFTLIPQNDLDDFGFTFIMYTGMIGRKSSIQILLRTDDRHHKTILVRKYQEEGYNTNIMEFIFERAIAINCLTNYTKTSTIKTTVNDLVTTLKRYFRFVFDNYHLC